MPSRFLVCSAVAALCFTGCAPEVTPDDPTGGEAGVGGSGPAGSGGTSAGSGGSAVGGTGGSAKGGTGGAGGTGGSSGGVGGSAGTSAAAGGSGGASGTAGSGGASTGGGGAGGDDGGGAGTGTAGGGTAGEGMGGSGGAGAGAGGASTAGAGGKGGMGAGGTAGSGGAMGGKSAGCGKAPTIQASMYNNGQPISIMAGNMQRRFILNVPTNYDNTKPYKLIIAFHQLDGNDRQMYANNYYHLMNLSGNNAIFVAPNGQKNGAACTTMNNGDGGCGWPNPNGSDIALADAVVAQIKENFCVDNDRVFATGWSYGGSMSYKTACERGLGGTKNNVPGYIRAIAVYSGAQLSGNCTPTTPVAYYGSHGDNDGVLGYDGGERLAQNFAMANGCTWAKPTKVTSGNHMCTDIMGCPATHPVKFCSFDGDHTPDPRDPGQGSSWQYQVVWDWFNRF